MLKTPSKSFVSQVVNAGSRANMPVNWCKIFAQSLLKVAEKLGVTLKVVVHDHCLWIAIEASEDYSEASSDNLCTGPSSANLDIVGFDYSEDLKEFSLITAVGYRNYWYNQKLFPALRGNDAFIRKIEDNYKPCYFDRQIRFNKFRCTFYSYVKTYSSLKDYLDDVCRDGIYRSRMTPDGCRRKLNNLGVTKGDAIDKLRDYQHEDYNVLEYLHIVTEPPINCAFFLAEDPATIADFEAQIERHIKGMLIIDEAWRYFRL